MGYETKLIIGKSYPGKESPAYFNVMATVDLCKPGYDGEVYHLVKTPRTTPPVYYYSDGDKVTKDLYDDPLCPVPLQDVLAALREDVKREGYRRFKWAIAILEAMKDDPEQLEVVLFGH